MRALYFALSLLAASLIWSGSLLGSGSENLAEDSATVISTTIVVLSAISVVGMLVGHARWARRLGLVLIGIHLITATLLEISVWWWVGLALSAIATAGLVGPGMKGVVRDLPAALGPPPEAVVLPLLLVGAPLVVAAISRDGLGPWQVVSIVIVWLSAPVYAKAWPGALIATRWAAPTSLAVAGITALPMGWAAVCLAGVVLRYAWSANARSAVRPLTRTGTRVPIPPELTPKDILDEAGYDSRGRRIEPT